MADLSITAANCVPVAPALIGYGTSGATITAGQAIYLEASSNTWKLADNNSATAEVRQATALALTGSASGQPIAYLSSGSVTLGATMTAGVAYYLSDTPGGICPVADLASGEYPLVIGIASSTTVLKLSFTSSGVAL
jgi:hypothetical protein